MAEVRNFETLVQNDGLDPIGEIQTGIDRRRCVFDSVKLASDPGLTSAGLW